MGVSLQFLYPLLHFGTLVVQVIIAAAVWRLVRSHESVSMTLMEMTEEIRKKNRSG